MIKKQAFDITLKNTRTGKSILIPVLPTDGKLTYKHGDTKAQSADIVNLGNVDFPTGVDLDDVGWSAFFPARYDPGYCKTSKLKKPLDYQATLLSWKAKRDPVQVIVPAAKINKRMYIKSYTPDHGKGAEGDIYYSIELVEYREVKPVKIKIDTGTLKKKKPPAARPAMPKKKTPKTYVVKKGDWLIKIAKKNKIKNWRADLYIPNKKPKGPLGNNPDLIFPGQKLKLP